jgi:diguanylate cyclase (GGDEF)-like protein/PAS domain S-box-containing protein
MGEDVSGDEAPSIDAAALAAGVRLAARLSGLPTVFLALADGKTIERADRHADCAPHRDALLALADEVGAAGRPLVGGTVRDVAPRLAGHAVDRLPHGCTGLIALPLATPDGRLVGVLGGLASGAEDLDPTVVDDLVDIACLVSAQISARRDCRRMAAEAATCGRREARLRAAVDSLTQFFWVIDAQGRYVEQNAWDRAAFGDLVGRGVLEADPPLEQGEFWHDLHRRVLAGEVVRQASWRQHPGGEGERWVETVMAPLVVDGAIEGLVGLTVDRTAEIEAERRRRASETLLRTAIDALPCALVICDAAGRHIVQNDVDRALWGDAIGKTIEETGLPAEAKAHMPGVIVRVLAGETVREQLRYPCQGRLCDFEEIYAPVRTENGITGFVGLAVDHTERATAERRLAEAEGRLSAAIDALPFPFFICDLDGRHVVQNACDRARWGDCIGKSFAEIGLPPELCAYLPEAIEQVSRGETVMNRLCYERNGRRLHEDEVYAPVYTDGVVTGFVGLTIDHTARVESERRLQESEARLADYVDTASDWVWQTDAQHRIVAITGLPVTPKLPADRVIGRRRWEIVGADPATEPVWQRHLADLDARRPFRGFVVGMPDVDGGVFWIELNGNPVHDEAGTFIGYRGTGRDITDRVLAEQRLRASEQRLADYLATASDWIWETDTAHRIILLDGNRPAGSLPLDAVLGRRRWEVAGADPDTDPHWREHRATLEAHQPFRDFVYSATDLAGRTAWIEVAGNPVFDDAGVFLGYRGTGRAVTDRLLAEQRLRASEQRLADYLATASDWLWETDAQHRVRTLAGWPKDARLPANRLLGRRRWDHVGVDPESDPHWRAHVRDLEDRRPFRGFVYAYSSEDHPEIWIELNGNPVFDADGEFLGYRGTARDVTARRTAEAALREAHAKLDAMAQSGLVGMTAGRGFLIEEANDAFLSMLGLDRTALAAGLDWRRLIPPEVVAEQAAIAERLAFTGAVYTTEVTYLRADGSQMPALLNSVVLDGEARRWFALIQDLTPMKLAEARVRELAERDVLTGLANRHVLFDRLRGELDERRKPGACGALLMLDLDGFKEVNDTLGHEAGDRLLQVIGARLTAVVRDTDTVARVGGDEFAVVLRGLQGPVTAAGLARKILDSLCEPLALDGRLVRPNASIGISLFPTDGRDPPELLKKADIALYKAKAKGRGAFRFFEPELLAALERRRELTDALQAAVGGPDFGIVLQPRIELASGRHVGLEALARWRVDGVELQPGAFIDIAEECGGIVPIGRVIRRQAVELLCRCEAAGLGPGTLALNVAAVELKQADFSSELADLLAELAVAPARIEIEVTENTLLDRESEKVACGLQDLHALGVTITLDDFGTGYASLTHLRRFPLDRLKIDGSLIRKIGVDANEAVIVRGITNFAHTLGMSVVAEGVETAEQLGYLRLHGCDFAQGYLIAEPLSPSGLETYLARQAQANNCHALSVPPP